MRKKIPRRIALAGRVLLMMLLFMGIKDSSLAQCCLTDSLVITTGYNPLTGTAVAAGTPAGAAVADPHWKICFIDNQLASDVTTSGYVAVVPVAPADVIPPAPGWASFGGRGNWVNCFNGYNYSQSTTNNYNWRACRTFRLNCDAQVTFHFDSLTADNWIMGGDIDGIPMPIPLTSYCCAGVSGGPINIFGGNPGIFYTLAPFVQNLPAGVHTITFYLRNDNPGSTNTGFATQGYIKTISASIAPESAVCNAPTICPLAGPAICAGATTTLNVTAGSGTWTSSDNSIATVDLVTGVVTGVNAGVAIISFNLPVGMGCPILTSVTVNPAPVISGPSVVGIGGSIGLGATPAGGSWSSSNTGVATVDVATGVVNGVTAGTAVISYISTDGCLSTIVITVAAPCCLTDHLIINTGYDPVTGLAVPAGTAGGTPVGDPHWKICAVDNLMTSDVTASGYIAVVPVAAADVIPPAPGWGWAPFPGGAGGPGNWINCFNGFNYTQTTSNNYNWTACRTFTLNCDAQVTFHFDSLTADNWIMGGDVDGVPMPIPVAPYCCGGLSGGSINVFGGNPGQFYTLAPFTQSLTTGVHTITFYMRNDNPSSTNTGFATQGYLTTVSSSIVPENNALCVQPTICPVAGPAICVGATATVNAAVAGGTWTSSNSSIASVDPVTGIITGVNPGTATISYSLPVGVGCPMLTTVTVNAAPTVTGPTVVTVGATVGLSGTPAGGSWTSSNAGVASVDVTTGVVTGITAGTATITYTLANGCFAILTITVPVPCCLTDHLIINTGYDPLTGLAVTAGAAGGTPVGDPHWKICAMDNLLTSDVTASGYVAVVPVAAADVIPPAPGWGWAPFPGGAGGPGNWINCFNGFNYTQTTSNNYNWTACRTFVLSCDAQVTFHFDSLTADNWIMGGDVDGVPMPIPVAPYCCYGLSGGSINVFGGNPGQFYTLAPFTQSLTAGVHTISFNMRNDNPSSTNTGFATQGYLTTISTSIVPENVVSCPMPTVCPVGGPTICAGATTTVNAVVSGGTWTSSNSGIASVDLLTGVITGVTPGVVIITYTLPAGIGCPVLTIVTVTAGPTITGPSTLCVGSTITLTGTPVGGTWTSSNTAVADVDIATGEVTGNAVGTAVISYTLASGCVATYVVTVSTATITGPSTVCVGSTIVLTGTPAGGTWWSSDYSVADVDPVTGVVTGVSGGSATIYYKSPAGCETKKTIKVSGPGIKGPSVVCAGSSITLTGSPAGGTWSSSPIYIAYVGLTSGVVTGILPGTTTIVYTVGGCHSSVVVTVKPLPVITGPLTVCVDDQVTLNATPAGGSWSSSNSGVADIDPTTGVVTGVSAGTAWITYTTKAGCKSVRIINVAPVPTISGPTTVCAGGTITLTGSPAGGTWTSSNPTAASIGLFTGIVTGNIAGSSVVITYVSPGGCRTKIKVGVTRLRVSISSEGDAIHSMCDGTTGMLPLTGSPAGGTWSSSSPAILAVSTAGNILSTSPGTTTITYTVSSGGCSGFATYTMTVIPNATVTTTTTVVCMGTPLTLTGSPAGGTWIDVTYANATVNPTTGEVTGFYPGPFYVRYDVAGYCQASYAVDIVGAAPNSCAMFVIADGGFQILGPTGATVTYNYGSPMGTGTVTCTGCLVGTTVGSGYSVPAFPGCCGASSWVQVTNVSYPPCSWDLTCTTYGVAGYKPAAGTDAGSMVSDIVMTPNPNSGQFTLSGTLPLLSQEKELQVEIVNMLGKVIYKDVIGVTDNTINKQVQLSNMTPDGVYLVKIRNKDVIKTIQFRLSH